MDPFGYIGVGLAVVFADLVSLTSSARVRFQASSYGIFCGQDCNGKGFFLPFLA